MLLCVSDDSEEKLPWKSNIGSSKEFFNTEILYRYDILHLEEREKVNGSYLLELEGDGGGFWTVKLANDINVENSREDADISLTMSQKDFLNIVNGELNPQLAILAKKIQIKGDIKKAIAFQSLLAPTGE